MRLRTRATLGSIALAVTLAMTTVGQAQAENYLQCVPFARMISGIQIFGDAWKILKRPTFSGSLLHMRRSFAIIRN